ncbi:hypothetical protein ACFSVM_00245 [Paenibacillus shunpengii]|uniref:Uncharacterized protein n=1 Tax=Paenibacillus shunpengii TaxID=2054424 RepID=A0ABW5SJT0_9BACL|nr:MULTISPECIES: hypothetical protein [unclassified Paenibacillus]OMC72371.1 hypothetical protein BK126_10415 [Paenibacillus sp. FSL H7-0326]GAK41734.1 hypothetical protein TCA2_4226 [Paenibacillus sp. TCA20]SDX40990.1 hypothetical protein SAMN05518848_10749 [Paenibacillus sp. PDC88]
MATNRRLITNLDFEEAMTRKRRIRVFKDNQQIDSGGVIIRYDEMTIVIQSSVSDIAYHQRQDCEFFELKS